MTKWWKIIEFAWPSAIGVSDLVSKLGGRKAHFFQRWTCTFHTLFPRVSQAGHAIKNVSHKCFPNCVCFIYSWFLYQKPMSTVSPLTRRCWKPLMHVLATTFRQQDHVQKHHIQPYIAIYSHAQPYIPIYNHIQDNPKQPKQLYIQPYAAIYTAIYTAIYSQINHIRPCTAIYSHIQPYTPIYTHIQPYTTE